MIKLLQCPTAIAVYNVSVGSQIKGGIVVIRHDHKDPCQLIDTETGLKFIATFGVEPGAYYEQEFYAIPV